MSMISERYREKEETKKSLLCRSGKAFEWIKWDKLMRITTIITLKEKSVNWKERKFIKELLHKKQKAAININESFTNWLGLDREVRQGYCQSPLY